MNGDERERVERKYRPHLFADCTSCGEKSVRTSDHVCDPIRRETYHATFAPPAYQPREEMVQFLEQKLLEVLKKHKIVVDSTQLRDLALAVEPSTAGPYAAGASGD
jgi:hypothetical protein